jgi:hypothetical protein
MMALPQSPEKLAGSSPGRMDVLSEVLKVVKPRDWISD